MLVKDLLEGVEVLQGRADGDMVDIKIDSKKVGYGDVFVAMKGSRFDGNDFAKEALDKGASYVISEQNLPFENVIVVRDARKAYAEICKNFFGKACDQLKLIGVTGTNGKTTTCNIIASVLRAGGKNVGVIGTLGARYNSEKVHTSMTTPDPYLLHKLFKEMKDDGVEYVVMEVSAHALALNKLEGVKFEEGILTNITEDHLDFFGDMENYAKAKMSFFDPKYMKLGIVFGEDRYGRLLMYKSKVPTICYGKGRKFDVSGRDIVTNFDGSHFVCDYLGEQIEIDSHLVGEYNVENLLAAIASTRSIGIGKEALQRGIKNLAPVEGRFNIINILGKNIIIDYAHTPDGLEKVLKTARALSDNKLVCIFGCGGNRDRQKRPIMGKIASTLADDVIITSDNPRFEKPEDIIQEIEAGVTKKCVCIPNRQQAIEGAMKKYKDKTTIVIAGKGAENYQEIEGKKYPFSDFEVVYNYARSLQKPLKTDKSYPFRDEFK